MNDKKLQAADIRLPKYKLQLFHLYQNSRPSVKKNPLIRHSNLLVKKILQIIIIEITAIMSEFLIYIRRILLTYQALLKAFSANSFMQDLVHDAHLYTHDQVKYVTHNQNTGAESVEVLSFTFR